MKPHWISALVAALIASALTCMAWSLWIAPAPSDPPRADQVRPEPRHEAKLIQPLHTPLESISLEQRSGELLSAALLEQIEQRLAALEEQIASLLERREVARESAPPSPSEDSLRELVSKVVAEDRATRSEQARASDEARRREELERNARAQAAAAAAQLSLQPWERDVFVELLVQLEERRAEIDRAFAEETKTPEDYAAEIQELEKWWREELARMLGPERAQQIAGF